MYWYFGNTFPSLLLPRKPKDLRSSPQWISWNGKLFNNPKKKHYSTRSIKHVVILLIKTIAETYLALLQYRNRNYSFKSPTHPSHKTAEIAEFQLDEGVFFSRSNRSNRLEYTHTTFRLGRDDGYYDYLLRMVNGNFISSSVNAQPSEAINFIDGVWIADGWSLLRPISGRVSLRGVSPFNWHDP